MGRRIVGLTPEQCLLCCAAGVGDGVDVSVMGDVSQSQELCESALDGIDFHWQSSSDYRAVVGRTLPDVEFQNTFGVFVLCTIAHGSTSVANGASSDWLRQLRYTLRIMAKHSSVALSWRERLLLLSFFFFGLASPIFLLFTNTFLWKENASPMAMITYNVGIYIGVALGFIANRTLLLKFPARALYQVSCVLQGIAPLILVWFSPKSATSILGLGLCFGLSAGLYFANRNFFTSLITQGKHRFAFLSLDTAMATVSAVLSPLLVGWYLTFAQMQQHVPITSAYLHTAIVGLVFLLCAGAFIYVPEGEAQQSTKRIFIGNASKRWNAVRLMDFVGGLAHGVFMTIPFLAALTLLTAEVSIGKMQSGATLIGALSIYVVGKYRTKIPHGALIGIWLVVSVIAGGLIAYAFSAWSVVAAAILAGAVGPLYRTSTAHLMYEAVDKESDTERASFLLDREIFIDVGRVVALIGCGVALHFSYDVTLRYGYLFATAIHIALLAAALRVSRHLRKA